MHTVHLKISGDQWVNAQQVEQELNLLRDPAQLICFDTGAEGISLKHSGILSVIDQWAMRTGHPADRIIINTPNNFESIPYRHANTSTGNHFFAMSKHYFSQVPCPKSSARLFGLFLGRHTQQRNIIASDCLSRFDQHFLISIMKPNVDLNHWSPDLHHIQSLDNMSVGDQYTGVVDTNASLLKFYPEFQIELVAETCCVGETFFPTEKTIRPLSAKKPVLIFGPQFFLANLQHMGFKTYDQCWDESYDRLEGQDRWQAMLLVIEHIIAQGYDKDLAESIAEHNMVHLTNWHQYTTPRDMPRVIHDG